ncbi:Protein of uncharacterised function (DUF2798) [Chromobacterium violaceum]|uniref:Protein of uncharacterized function (DUF2798) n=1 Tax=Chromobacterium violaceum TaxID=536 RepID=A0A447T6A6_CHRVL|nr:Protein of uncharacterised function (DUF2798) [Chromobacterium violaceum]
MSLALRQRLLFSLLMSAAMSFLMTAWVCWLNLGLRPDFIGRWLHAFASAWPPPSARCCCCAAHPPPYTTPAERTRTSRRRPAGAEPERMKS